MLFAAVCLNNQSKNIEIKNKTYKNGGSKNEIPQIPQKKRQL